MTYDDALVRAQQMALAIGGYRGLDGFQSFNLGSYIAGDLDHKIDKRPIFDKDPLDDLETEQTFWTVAKAARDAGEPLEVYLEDQGWSEEKIARITNSLDYQSKQAGLQTSIAMSGMINDGTPPTPLKSRFKNVEKGGNQNAQTNNTEQTGPTSGK